MSISSEDILHFLELITQNNSKSTKRRLYSQLRGFFNLIIPCSLLEPCGNPGSAGLQGYRIVPPPCRRSRRCYGGDGGG